MTPIALSPDRLDHLAASFSKLRLGVLGDFCLDRYLEIDPSRSELSIETGLEVFNITRVRSQPGGAGTILNNLEALGVGELFPIGFAGQDGEGWELIEGLKKLKGVRLDGIVQTPERHTFTYTKPLVITEGQSPRELNRLDIKNWSVTPIGVEEKLISAVEQIFPLLDGLVILDQAHLAETGVVTEALLDYLARQIKKRPSLPVVADSRRGLKKFPPAIFKMNRDELRRLVPGADLLRPLVVEQAAKELALKNKKAVVVTLSEGGILGADASGSTFHIPALPVRGELDIVGAGDAVTANLITVLAANGTLVEAVRMANIAASVVIHQLGTTGTASVDQIRRHLSD